MKNLIFALCIFSSIQLNAQSEIWSQTIEKGAYFSQLDNGKIFLKNAEDISLINNETGEIEWSSKVATDDDPKFLEDLSIMYFSGKAYAVIDATTGHIIDSSTSETEILDIHYYWDAGRVVLELNREDKLYIVNIELDSNKESWSTEIGKVKSSLFGLLKSGTRNKPALASDGTLMIVEKKYISLVSASGAVTARVDYNKKIEMVGYNPQQNIMYIVEDKKILHFVSGADGKSLSSIKLKEKDHDLLVLADGNTLAITEKKILLLLNASNGNEIASNEFKGKITSTFLDEESGRYFVLAKKEIAEIDVNTGDIINTKTQKKASRKLYVVNDKVFLSSYAGQCGFDLNTLEIEHEKPVSISPIDDYVSYDGYMAYLSRTSDGRELTMINSKGKKLWSRLYKSNSYPTVDVIDGNLLVISNLTADYVSTLKGKSLWQNKIKVDPSFKYVINQHDNSLIIYSGMRLYFVNVDDGRMSRSADRFKFRDFDYRSQQPQIIGLEDNVFLKGSNTVYIINSKGETLKTKHYKSISNTSGLMKLANIAVTAAAIGTGNGDKVISVYSNNKRVHKGAMVDDLQGNWAYADGLREKRQAKQNKSSSAFPYVYTKLEDGKKGLIFLTPEDGEKRFDISMNEKSPNYLLDEVDGVLFIANKETLRAIDVK